ncbi:hypothetical protein GW17_00018164 [Ensete ventricosum]|nr:hypothetical protein GW17_00018164 [Ensete ventricosum]
MPSAILSSSSFRLSHPFRSLLFPTRHSHAGGRSVPLLVGGRGDGLLCDPLDRGLPHIVGELYILLQRK